MAAVILEPWENRTTADKSIDGIMEHLRQEFGTIKEAQLFAFAPPPIDGLGNASGFQMEVQDMGDLGPVVLQEMVDEMVEGVYLELDPALLMLKGPDHANEIDTISCSSCCFGATHFSTTIP